MPSPTPTIAPATGDGPQPRPAAPSQTLPVLIQGGMGVAVSSWRLAHAVSRSGQFGVVSGTALDVVVARRLQDGYEGGHVRRALEHFPVLAMAQRVLRRYHRPDGRESGRPYIPVPKLRLDPPARALDLAVVANFVEAGWPRMATTDWSASTSWRRSRWRCRAPPTAGEGGRVGVGSAKDGRGGGVGDDGQVGAVAGEHDAGSAGAYVLGDPVSGSP